MKQQILFVLLLSLICISVHSQPTQIEGIHGLKNHRNEYLFEVQGYNVVISTYKGKINNEKTVKKIKKHYKIEGALNEYREDKLSIDNLALESVYEAIDNPSIRQFQISFLYQATVDTVGVVIFNAINQRNIVLEHDILNAHFANELEQYVTSRAAKSINFGGRDIKLGNKCFWRSAHCVDCMNSTIDWSEFNSLKEAEKNTEAMIGLNTMETFVILSDTTLNVLFEGVSTTARRIVYRPKFKYDNNTPIARYYISETVRGKHISCILSQNVNVWNDYNISNLMSEVMVVDPLPKDGQSKYDYIRYQGLTPQEEEVEKLEKENNINTSDIHLGTMIPLDNLDNAFATMPYFTASLRLLPLYKSKQSIDLYMSLGFPVHKKRINFQHEDNKTIRAKTDLYIGMGLQYRYQFRLSKKVYLTPHVGVGSANLMTNRKRIGKDKDGKDRQGHYSIGAVDVFGGAKIRYKKIGLFTEYHYSPYNQNKRSNKELGNQTLNMGVSISL